MVQMLQATGQRRKTISIMMITESFEDDEGDELRARSLRMKSSMGECVSCMRDNGRVGYVYLCIYFRLFSLFCMISVKFSKAESQHDRM